MTKSIERVNKAIEEMKKGNMVIMIDNEDRENEGDLIYASTFSTPEKVNFMATYGKGLICVALDNAQAKKLDLFPMVSSNTSSYETAFTVSVDGAGAKTGISAYERDDTIKILANPISKKEDLVRPGHIFPLIAKEGGVLVRTGHTEGSVDLCKLSGISACAVICEIMKDDGEMARRDDLDIFGEKHNLVTVFISDLVEYRARHESIVKESTKKESEFLGAKVIKHIFIDHASHTHNAFSFGSISETSLVKFHNISNDMELFEDYDKYSSLIKAIDTLKKENGILIFLNKSDSQEDAMRNFGIGAGILKELGIKKIRLLVRHKKQREFIGIDGFGLEITEEVAI